MTAAPLLASWVYVYLWLGPLNEEEEQQQQEQATGSAPSRRTRTASLKQRAFPRVYSGLGGMCLSTGLARWTGGSTYGRHMSLHKHPRRPST